MHNFQNPLINQFNNYTTRNPNLAPFQNNQLINGNVHVINNLNDLVQQHKNIRQNIPHYQQQISQNNKASSNKSGIQNFNVIEEMLKPQKIVTDNSDVKTNFSLRKKIQDDAARGNVNIEITNLPYKTIIKDKIINKNVEDIVKEDLLVHKSIKEIDANLELFNKNLCEKKMEKDKIYEELEIEFHIDNYDKHKKKFEYKETFIKNLAFKENTFGEGKQDFIDFYRQKQREAEDGQKLCDHILHSIIDDGIVSKDELPMYNDNIDDDASLKNITKK